MENLNAKQVKKGLECCLTTSEGDCIACGYRGKKDGLFITCTNCLMADALALINKQETEYNELYELCESYRIERDAMRGAANSYKLHCKTLEKENESLKTLLDESYDAQNTVRADTVRKMQTLIEEKADSCDICLINSHKPIDIIYQIFKKQLDQIAKEMLEGDNEN